MIGNRSPRYVRFGWAAARFDDAANFVAARVDRPAGGGVRACWWADHPPGRYVRGAATRPVTPAPTRVWWRPPSPERWACGSAGRRSTHTNWRSGRRSATGELPRSPISLGRCGCRESCRPRRSRSASAPSAVSVGELLLGREWGGGCVRRSGLLPSALPDLGVHEVAQQNRGHDAERDPLDAVRQERTCIEPGQADDAEAAGLILDQLDI